MSALLGLRPEVQDTCISLGLMLLIVLFMGLGRVIARQQLHRHMVHAFVLEFLATFQLCCCTHELQLLGEQDSAHPTWTLTLIYFFSLVHGLTLVGTASNPCGVMLQMILGGMPPDTGAMRLLAQLVSALCSRYFISALWSLSLTNYHFDERILACRNPIHTDISKAIIIEAICSFIFHSALLHFQEVRTKLRIHLLAALITFLAYAGLLFLLNTWQSQASMTRGFKFFTNRYICAPSANVMQMPAPYPGPFIIRTILQPVPSSWSQHTDLSFSAVLNTQRKQTLQCRN